MGKVETIQRGGPNGAARRWPSQTLTMHTTTELTT
jgi:hypothetical protein